MRRRRLLVCALLLAHPVLLLRGYAPDVLPMLLLPAAVIVGLLRGSRTAHGAALALSLGVAAVALVFNGVTVAEFALGEPWPGDDPWYVSLAPTIAREMAVALASAAAFVLLLRDGAHAGTRERVLAALLLAFGIELVLTGLIAVRAWSLVGDSLLVYDLLALSQVPGQFFFDQVGYCCMTAELARPSLSGVRPAVMPILLAANTFGLLPATLFLRATLEARRAEAAPGGARVPAPAVRRDP